MQNKVISASAGSGKTHRLAIEYIAILMKNLDNKEFHFERILVITFTKKATAEIRNKIFFMLEELQNRKNADLVTQVENKIGFKITEKILQKLQKQIILIKTSKDKVRITTIDSLINSVFKSMIAPIMKLSNYTIDDNANFEIWESVFERLWSNENTLTLKRLNEVKTEKSMEAIGEVIKGLICNRWILQVMQTNPPHPKETNIIHVPNESGVSSNLFKSAFTGEYISFDEQFQKEKEKAKKKFITIFSTYCHDLKCLFDEKGIADLDKCLTKAGKVVIKDLSDFMVSVNEFTSIGMYNLSKEDIAELIKGENIKLYHGNYIKGNPLGDIAQMKVAFLRFLYYEYVAVEFQEVLKLWQSVLGIYDQIKLNTAVLTHDDIAFYTYKYLYMPEYSMIDKKNFIVENLFYEFLAVRNQYLLIDEFQDTSLIQFIILAPMIKELSSGNSIFDDTSVIIVGDEKQSIYGWRNGEKGLLNFMQSYLKTITESLTTCYRSTPVIVDFVNEIFNEKHFKNFNHYEKAENWNYKSDITTANNNSQGSVNNYFYKFDKEQSPHKEFVEKVVLPALKGKLDNLGEVAVIARKNSDLEDIAQLLNENNIPCVLESSNSIFNHQIPKIVIYMMRYLQYNDYNALLKFLRSDVVFIGLAQLKKIAVQISKGIMCECNNSELTVLNPLSVCYEIIKRFNFKKIFNKETDIKNMHNFLNIISEFLISPGEYTANLDGFIRYAEKMQEKESQKQTSIQDKMAVYLTTIHKSKGLGFDSVFIYLNTKKTKHNFNLPIRINCLINNQHFDSLSDLFLTINFHSVVRELFPNEFKLIEHKNTIEELNTYYVAITRAKTNLSIFWMYDEKELETENHSITAHITKLAMNICENKHCFVDNVMKSICVEEQQHVSEAINYNIIPKYIDFSEQKLMLDKISDYVETQDLKDIFINKKHMLFGNVTHFYLSFIKYNKPDEHKIAYMQTINQFGNILSKNEIITIVNHTKKFITQNHDYFNEKWDKIFNEIPIIDQNNKHYRIDRLMINTSEKEILIIDYKTGKVTDENQIDRYIRLLKNVPIYKKGGYQVNGIFVTLPF